MAPPYSNGYNYGYPSSTSSYDYGYSLRNNGDFQSICDDIFAVTRTMLHRMSTYANGPGRRAAWNLATKAVQQFKRNMTRRRLLSFPHALFALWILVLLWGERWIFASRVNSCDWDHWENWVSLRVLRETPVDRDINNIS